MKPAILSTFLVLIALPCIAQHSHRPSFTLYQNTDIFQTEHIEDWTETVTSQSNFNMGRISLAFSQVTKKGIAHEAELFIPEFGKPVDKLQFPIQYQFRKSSRVNSEAVAYAFRYEIHKHVGGQTDRVEFRFGLGINPFFVRQEYHPHSPNAYYSKLQLYGFALNAIPRLRFALSERFSIDLNAPIRVYNIHVEKNRRDNPILPLRQQRQHRLKHLFFEPVYTIRLGLRYSLNE